MTRPWSLAIVDFAKTSPALFSWPIGLRHQRQVGVALRCAELSPTTSDEPCTGNIIAANKLCSESSISNMSSVARLETFRYRGNEGNQTWLGVHEPDTTPEH